MLTGPAAYSVDGDDLTLRATGEPAMHFVAAPLLPAPTLDVQTFVGATWRLAAMTDAKGIAQLVPREATLRVADGTLTVTDGCNTLSAPVQVSGQDLAIKVLKRTAIGCTGSTAATAATIDRFFAGPSVHGDAAGSTLNVKGDGVGVLTYEWVPDDPAAVAPTALTGREWVLTSIAGVVAHALGSPGVDARGPTPAAPTATPTSTPLPTSVPGPSPSAACRQDLPPVCTGAAAEQAATIDSILGPRSRRRGRSWREADHLRRRGAGVLAGVRDRQAAAQLFVGHPGRVGTSRPHMEADVDRDHWTGHELQ